MLVAPGCTLLPFNWFDFTMLYFAGVEAVVLLLPREWQREILQILFRTRWNS
jgi:hypothetical protein